MNPDIERQLTLIRKYARPAPLPWWRRLLAWLRRENR